MSGVETDFSEFFRRHAPEVLSVCFRVLGNRQDAEDVASEAFCEMWSKRERCDETRGSARTYLMLIARSRAIDRYRANARKSAAHAPRAAVSPELLTQASASPLDQLSQQELSQRATVAIHELEVSQRQMLELAFFEGLSHSQIATRLDQPLGTVKSQIRRALLKLRSVLQAFDAGTFE